MLVSSMGMVSWIMGRMASQHFSTHPLLANPKHPFRALVLNRLRLRLSRFERTFFPPLSPVLCCWVFFLLYFKAETEFHEFLTPVSSCLQNTNVVESSVKYTMQTLILNRCPGMGVTLHQQQGGPHFTHGSGGLAGSEDVYQSASASVIRTVQGMEDNRQNNVLFKDGSPLFINQHRGPRNLHVMTDIVVHPRTSTASIPVRLQQII